MVILLSRCHSCLRLRAAAVLFLALGAASAAHAQFTVSLTPSVSSGASVGTQVTWTATADNPNQHPYRYKFLVHAMDRAPRVLKDFGPTNTLDWVPSEEEGQYTVDVTVNDLSTGDSASATANFNVMPAVTGNSPVVNPSVHPLVMLYSAPPCPAGNTMTVHFASAGQPIQSTPAKACDGARTMNFYLAGLHSATQYSAYYSLLSDIFYSESPAISFTSGTMPDGLPVHTKLYGDTSTLTQGVMLASSLFNRFVATDLNGDVIWYYPQNGFTLARAETGGRFLSFYEDPSGDTSQQILREFDLTGSVITETTAESINNQLYAMGKQPINAFHHEAAGFRTAT